MDKQTLMILDKMSKQYYDYWKNHPDFAEAHRQVDKVLFYELRNAFFSLITGEPDFDKFYSRFDAPAIRTGKPVAWGPRFWPDLIDDEFWTDKRDINDRVKVIKKLYRKCLKLEKNYKK